MATYQLICLDSSAHRISVRMEGEDEADLRRQADRHQWQLISFRCLQSQSVHGPRSRKPLNMRQLASFCGRLAPLLEMNIPTRQALGFLADNSPDAQLRQICREIKDKMESMSLSDAVKSTRRLSPMLEGIIQAGSDSSDLAQSLQTMGRFYQMILSMQTGIRNALIQPAIALFILVGFLLFSLFFTIPQIAKLLDGLGTKPGWIIEGVFRVSHLLLVGWPLVLLALLIGLYLMLVKSPLRSSFLELIIRKWPAFRSVFHNLRQTALLYAMAILVKAQIPQGQVFRYLIEVSRDTPMESQLRKALEFHSQDGRFARALEKFVELDPEIIFTLRVGEETSSLHLQAEKLAQIFEKSSLQASEALAAKVAPVMVIVTALFAALLFSLTFGSVISVCLKLIRNGA